MPNHCYYEMRVRGKRENIEQLIKVMTDYDEPKHFWRVFSAEAEYQETDDPDISTARIYGDCAWSVYACMMTGELTYADHADISHRTSLQEESERLELEIEVYSDEPGCAFQEHYRFRNGEKLSDECVDCIYYYFETLCNESDEEYTQRFERFKQEYGLDSALTPDDLNDASEIVVGGFGEWNFKI